MGLHEAVERRLDEHDQRYTPMRRLLVEALASSGRPLTVPEVLEHAPGLPQSSAYRNVTALIDAGVVRRVATADDHWRVELAEEISGHHHHLVCGRCGRVEDVPPSVTLEEALGATARLVASRTGFVVNEHRLDLVGTCAACDEAMRGPASAVPVA
jgi:Fe2+ or Zn2+ uptake regulation protein